MSTAAPPPQDSPHWAPGGRSPRWRLGMVAAGALTGGLGLALYLRPQILIWLLAGILVALGSVLLLSGLLARGR